MLNFKTVSKVAAAVVATFILFSCDISDENVFQDIYVEDGEEEASPLPGTEIGIDGDYRHIDIFVYEEDSGLRKLQMHLRDSAYGPVTLHLREGEKTVMCVSDLDGIFNDDALQNAGALENLSIGMVADGSPMKISSGMTVCKAGDTCRVSLTPAYSTIRINSVSNNLERYSMIEDPYLYLADAASSVEIFRTGGFFPTERSDSISTTFLPCDIGYYTQFPDLDLICYPDEAAQTQIVFRCTINGCPCMFRNKLPAIRRNCKISVDLEIDGPDMCRIRYMLI